MDRSGLEDKLKGSVRTVRLEDVIVVTRNGRPLPETRHASLVQYDINGNETEKLSIKPTERLTLKRSSHTMRRGNYSVLDVDVQVIA
jgi:hypothetical protein